MLGVLLLLLPDHVLAAIPSPTFLGKIEVGATIWQARASADEHRLVARVGSSLRVIDISHPEKPVVQGTLDNVTGDLFLARDGRRGLLVDPPLGVHGPGDREIRRVIYSLDISDPQHPKISERREVTARYLAVADDASAYAASQRNPDYESSPGKPDVQWRTTITWTAGIHAPVVIEDEQWGQPGYTLSAAGAYLVDVKWHSSIQITDVTADKPLLYEQAMGSNFQQQHRSLSAILGSGRAVVEDARTARFNVYDPIKGVPRVATLPHEDGVEYSQRLDNDPSGAILTLSDCRGFVRRIDLGKQEIPSDAGEWQLPLGVWPKAATRSLLIASGGTNNQELRLYALEFPVQPRVNWRAIDSAYRKAMAKYDKERRGPGNFSATTNFVFNLEAAGILQALEAVVEGIPPRRAAAIFNDYGFLAGKGSFGAGRAEKALRRAIALDPQRAPAARNLADLLRSRLRQVTNYPTRSALAFEIENLYRRYRELGGKWDASIEAFMARNPASGDEEGICATIAAYANAGRMNEILSSSAVDLPAGNRKVDLIFGSEGSAHVPTMYVFDAATDFPLDDAVVPPGNDYWGGDELGLVVHHDGAHILHFKDVRHPVDSVSVTGDSSCRFSPTHIEVVGPKALEPELCRDLSKGSGPPSIEFAEPAGMDYAIVAERYGETGAGNKGRVDFANDGHPSNLVEMELSSGAGAGCDAEFFDMIGKDGKLASGPKQKLLVKLQGADPDGRYPMACGNSVRFFEYRGKVYFENRPKNWPPDSARDQYHRVTRVDQGKVVDVCDFRFETKVSVD